MPCTVLVRVPEARNLPVMDRQSESTDAFVEVRLGKDDDLRRSEVCRRSLNPVWETAEWFTFELDDDELQDEPLQVRVIDHDKISSHDVIGRVYVSLGPLLVGTTHSAPPILDGWFPIYDTLRGVRGEVRVVVKLEVLLDANRYRQSSAGVTFCASTSLPCTYSSVKLLGFVEELVINDDPEYQWIDNIRSKRKSNEERQSLLQKLSCELQRRVGVKVLDAGANAVLGYRQCLDLEGESGIVLRCIGTMAQIDVTAVGTPPMDATLVDRPYTLGCVAAQSDSYHGLSPCGKEPLKRVADSLPHTPSDVAVNQSNLASQVSSSFSEEELIQATTASAQADGTVPRRTSVKPAWLRAQGRQPTEFPFFTVTSLPVGVLRSIAGLVACRSVEFLGITTDEVESRDAWWQKLRREVLSHMQAWGCNAVIGYEEYVTIDDEVVVLSASGTAAVIQLGAASTYPVQNAAVASTPAPTPDVASAAMQASGTPHPPPGGGGGYERHAQQRHPFSFFDAEAPHCTALHVPTARWEVLLSQNEQTKCGICGLAPVPSILLCSVELPQDLLVIGRGNIVQSRVCRVKKKASGEASAVAVSSLLPFIESTLHRQLIVKLQRSKMNAIFGLKTQLSVSESYVIAVATGTAVRLAALPLAGELVSANMSGDDSKVFRKESGDGAHPVIVEPTHSHPQRRPSLVSMEHLRDLPDVRADRSIGLGDGKGSAFLEVDDSAADEDGPHIGDILESEDVCCSTLQSVPGVPFLRAGPMQCHQLCAVQRVAVDSPRTVLAQLGRCMSNAVVRLYYRAASSRPCSMCRIDFDIEQYDDGEELQVTARACVFSYDQPRTRLQSLGHADSVAAQAAATGGGDAAAAANPTGQSPVRAAAAVALPTRTHRLPHTRSYPLPLLHPLASGVHRVMLSSCDAIPGYQLVHHRGYVCVFLVRESTSLREDHGSMAGMLHGFLVEAQAVARSHVNALGGNALLSFHMEISELEENSSNQGQCLLVVSGDAVFLCETDRDTAV